MFTRGLVALFTGAALAGNAAAFEFDEEGDNLLGYKGTTVTARGGYYVMTNAADMDEPAMRFINPKTGVVNETDLIDNTDIYRLVADNQFTWGKVDIRFTQGVKDGANRDGHVFVTSGLIDTPWRALKLYANVEHQYFEHGRNEKHLRYGIGFGAPILNGQLLTGYLAKRDTDIKIDGHQLTDGDNGYVFGLKADYKFNKSWTYHFLGEYGWDKKFTEITQKTYPGPAFLPIYELSSNNLSEDGFRMVNSVTYQVTDGLKLGMEYIYVRGDAILLEDPGTFGTFLQYSF